MEFFRCPVKKFLHKTISKTLVIKLFNSKQMNCQFELKRFTTRVSGSCIYKLQIWIYIYIFICKHTYTCIYIYIYLLLRRAKCQRHKLCPCSKTLPPDFTGSSGLKFPQRELFRKQMVKYKHLGILNKGYTRVLYKLFLQLFKVWKYNQNINVFRNPWASGFKLCWQAACLYPLP